MAERARRCLLPLLALLLAGCGMERRSRDEELAAALTGGDPSAGRARIGTYGCGACHTIPGVAGARALVGPPLGGIARRAYIGGVLPNTPESMIRWLQDPPAIDAKTAMPNLGVTAEDARHIAAYLYTLRD